MVSAQPQDEQPLVVVNPSSWDFGTLIDTDAPVVKEFVIQNRSKQTIELFAMPTTCGCTVVKPEPSVMEPGQSSQVRVVFMPKGMHDVIQWEVKLALTPPLPNQSYVLISLKANVLLDAIISQPVINFKGFKRGNGSPVVLWLACYKQPDFKLEQVEFDAPGFDIAWKELPEVTGFYPGPQRGYRIDVAPKLDIPYGRNDGTIILRTTIKGNETIKIPVFAYVNGDITAIPDYIRFGNITPGTKYTKRLALSQNEFKKFTIRQVKTSIPWISAQIQPVLDHYYYLHLQADCPTDAEAGEFRGKCIVETDCPTDRKSVV